MGCASSQVIPLNQKQQNQIKVNNDGSKSKQKQQNKQNNLGQKEDKNKGLKLVKQPMLAYKRNFNQKNSQLADDNLSKQKQATQQIGNARKQFHLTEKDNKTGKSGENKQNMHVKSKQKIQGKSQLKSSKSPRKLMKKAANDKPHHNNQQKIINGKANRSKDQDRGSKQKQEESLKIGLIQSTNLQDPSAQNQAHENKASNVGFVELIEKKEFDNKNQKRRSKVKQATYKNQKRNSRNKGQILDKTSKLDKSQLSKSRMLAYECNIQKQEQEEQQQQQMDEKQPQQKQEQQEIKIQPVVVTNDNIAKEVKIQNKSSRIKRKNILQDPIRKQLRRVYDL